jgi:hypothetical protein
MLAEESNRGLGNGQGIGSVIPSSGKAAACAPCRYRTSVHIGQVSGIRCRLVSVDHHGGMCLANAHVRAKILPHPSPQPGPEDNTVRPTCPPRPPQQSRPPRTWRQ